MDTHDFSEIYAIGGPSIKLAIEDLLKYEHGIRYTDNEHIEMCAKYLLSLNNEEFMKLYVGTPKYYDAYGKKYKKYYYSSYVYAYTSSIELIQKCLAISKIPINNSIRFIHNMDIDGDLHHIHLDIESCKLLHAHGCDLVSLLYIACNVNDYKSIKYIINNMSEIEYEKIILYEVHENLGSIKLLVIDHVCKLNDIYLNALLKDTIMDTNFYRDRDRIINQCYYIIKYMTIESGKKLVTKLNKDYADKFTELTIDNNIKHLTYITRTQTILNDVMDFHFKIRGSHTKAASTL
jgi:hypothetical protein